MIERFYSIKHLTTEQLRELYSAYREKGWIDFDFYELMPEGISPFPAPLTDEEILSNINADNTKNYFVFMLNHENEQDGIMIGFGLTDYPDFGVYLHLDKNLLNEITEKYNLNDCREGEDYSKRYQLKNGTGKLLN